MTLSYEDLCGEICTEFDEGFENNDGKYRFAPWRLIQEVMSEQRLKNFYLSVKHEGNLSPAGENQEQFKDSQAPSEEDHFVRSVNRGMFHEFIAVIIYGRCKKSAAAAFVNNMALLGGTENERQRAEQPYGLPQGKEKLKSILGSVEDATRFYGMQHHFCVIVIGSSELVTIKRNEMRSLPLIYGDEKNLGSGSFGKVETVTIAAHHLTTTTGDFTQTNTSKKVLARKSFADSVNPSKDFKKELQTIRKIVRSHSINKHILTSVAAIDDETSNPQYYLLMPLADMDLQTFMETDQKLDMSDKANFIGCIMGLADGLKYLHGGEIRDTDGEHICYHLDLKADNIFVFFEDTDAKFPESCDYGKMVWKLGDFGISRVKVVEPGQRKGPGRVLDAATPTANTRWLYHSSPPEAEKEEKQMNEKSDVWSFGCLISFIFTFMERGSQGLTDFANKRYDGREVGIDVFWDNRKPIYTIHKQVLLHHKSLVEEARKRSSVEGAAVSSMLKFLEEKVFQIEQSKRCDARDILHHLRKIQEQLKRPVAEEPFSKSFKTTLRRYRAAAGNIFESRPPRKEESVNIWRWRLQDRKISFQGCESSPDQNFFVYWNETVIQLFVRRSMREDQDLETVSTASPATIDKCWKAVKLTNRYLIALTTAKEQKCYIYRVEGVGKLDMFTSISLEKNREIDFLSVCSQDDSMACILRDPSGRGTKLYTARIQYRDLEHNETADTTEPKEEHYLFDQKFMELGQLPISEVKHLNLQAHRHCYVVTQQKSKPLDLSVTLFSLETATSLRKTLRLKSYENTEAWLFADIACFPIITGLSSDEPKPRAILVTHSEQLWYFEPNESETGLTAIPHPPITSYYIRRIGKCHRTDRIFALAKRAGKGSIVLLEIGLRPNNVDPKVTEVAILDGLTKDERLNLNIHYDAGVTTVSVMSVATRRQDCVYKVTLD
ncbi:kinase-like domain-containing protein [Fusarium flagelliforme]|uniref:kinase-like domain-containing protein n=1 Tax=Fusarium flagelliforme TaxID=2675880 RepID=UPI001E8D427E|nr:kinase-like domain-containing protein [Fusarium flagelliforme]KAH7192826.1 kinase-like domain-containing protein [Fusarium flagelliforme]